MSTIEFNDAQLKCMDFFNNLSSDSKEVCVEMPTGTGKSYMILNRLDSKAITERCVIVFPRLALLLQFRHTYLGKNFLCFIVVQQTMYKMMIQKKKRTIKFKKKTERLRCATLIETILLS